MARQLTGRVESFAARQADGEGEGAGPSTAPGLGAWRADRQGRRREGRLDRRRRRLGAERPLGPQARRRRGRGVRAPRWRPPRGRSPIEELSKLQATVARRMAESKATAPHFYLEAEIDMTRAVEARGRVKELAGAGPQRALLQRHDRQGLRRWRCASTRAPTAPTATAASSSTRGSTSASPSPPATRSSSPPSSTPTARACGRSATSRGRWPRGSATARSPRPSSPARPSPSPTSGCSGSTASPR